VVEAVEAPDRGLARAQAAPQGLAPPSPRADRAYTRDGDAACRFARQSLCTAAWSLTKRSRLAAEENASGLTP
jgi:hypothetical protein